MRLVFTDPGAWNPALAEPCADKDLAKLFSANAVVRLWECPDLQGRAVRGPFDEAPQASFVFDHAEHDHIQPVRVQHRQALCTFTMGRFPSQSEPKAASLERASAADEEKLT